MRAAPESPADDAAPTSGEEDTKPLPNNLPKFGMPQESLVESDDDEDDSGFEVLATKRTWRYEVVGNGRYYILRRGSGKKREYKFGGKFKGLSKERQAQYYVNRAVYHFYREQAAARNGRTYRARNPGERPEILQ